METLDHCVICYMEVGDNSSLEHYTRWSANGDICRRFFVLACRYLNLGNDHFQPESTVSTRQRLCAEQVCNECFPLIDGFCEMYDQWQILQLEMNMRLQQIEQAMLKSEDESNLEFTGHRQILQAKLKRAGATIEMLDEFRSQLHGKISEKIRETFPYPQVAVDTGCTTGMEPADPTEFLTTSLDVDESPHSYLHRPWKVEPEEEPVKKSNQAARHTNEDEDIMNKEDEEDLGTSDSPESSSEPGGLDLTFNDLPSSHIEVKRLRSNGRVRGGRAEPENEDDDVEWKPYKCRYCSKGFTSSAGVASHERIHTGQKRFSCTKCDRTFSNAGTWRYHETHDPHSDKETEKVKQKDVDDKKKEFRCSTCGKRFAKQAMLSVHEGTHTRPFACKYCSMRFGASGNLKTHEMIHTGEKPFKCDVCNKGFRKSSDLRRHAGTHTVRADDGRYQCKICQQLFPRIDMARRHGSSTHNSETCINVVPSKKKPVEVETEPRCGKRGRRTSSDTQEDGNSD